MFSGHTVDQLNYLGANLYHTDKTYTLGENKIPLYDKKYINGNFKIGGGRKSNKRRSKRVRRRNKKTRRFR
jgi:hypothetical protein